MATLRFTSAFATVMLYLILCQGVHIIPRLEERYDQKCTDLSKKPYFDIEQVIGKTWRVYYTWGVQMKDKCLDMTVSNATTTIANQFYSDMHEYLQTQPVWDAATIYIRVGTANHEMLLFADHLGAAGSFLGVPNVVRNGDITPMRNGVPLIKLFLKLLHRGEYLVMIDCSGSGVASFMSWKRKPYGKQVADVAKSLNFGNGTHACISE